MSHINTNKIMMKNITKKLLFAICISIGLQSCNPDDSSLVEGRPESIVNTDPDGAPPRALIEDWSDHDEQLYRQALNNFVGVYFDPEVDRSSEWTFDLFGNIWSRTLSVYGRYGEPSSLYVVGHGEDKSTYFGTYLETSSGKRNIIDFPLTTTEFDSQTADQALALLASIVESAYAGNSGAPASNVWNSKFAEIFIYDTYLSQGLEAEAERVKAEFEAKSETYPSADSYWFRDWLLPLYQNYNQEVVFNSFFNLIKTYFPSDAGSYAGTMNVGEFVHFFSGAAGVSVKQMFEDAFGWDDSRARELLIAQARFPLMPYSFPPASQIIDVTTEGSAEIYVTSEYGGAGGRDGAEGSPKLIDGDYNTKFLTGGFPKDFYMQQNLDAPLVVNKYIMVSGNDAHPRDFKTWELYGSNDDVNFDLLHKVTDEVFTEFNQEKTYDFENTTAYQHYRLVLLENNTSNLIQLSEWRLKRLELLNFDPVDVTAGATISVSRDYSGGATGSEGSLNLIDGNKNSKFLTGGFSNGISTDPLVITLELTQAEPVNYYEWTSGNDAPNRDPKKWTVEGSTDGTTWVQLDSRDQADPFDARNEDYAFRFTNTTDYIYYRWTITENFGSDPNFQASELRLFKE